MRPVGGSSYGNYRGLEMRHCTQKSELAITRGNPALRRRACVPWRDGGKSPRVRSWSSYENETRASWNGDDGWVGMCASAFETALLTSEKLDRANQKYTV